MGKVAAMTKRPIEEETLNGESGGCEKRARVAIAGLLGDEADTTTLEETSSKPEVDNIDQAETALARPSNEPKPLACVYVLVV